LILKDKIGEEITSYIVIAIAGVLGFIGFVKIHELPAEKIIPYWFRHYLFLAKPIHYISDEEYMLQHQKKKKNKEVSKNNYTKLEIKEMKKKEKQLKILVKARKKYGRKLENDKTIKTGKKNRKEKINKTKERIDSNNDELSRRLSRLSKEQQEALLKLLER